MSIAEILDKAADLIEPEGMWTQVGGPRKGSADDCCCAFVAIGRVGGSKWLPGASEFFARFITDDPRKDGPGRIWAWNDAPERTQPEVVAKLREAAAKARAEGL